MERLGLLPFELLAHPAWRGLTHLGRADRAPLRLVLLQAWDKRDKAPMYWAQMQRKAMDMGKRANPNWSAMPWHDHA